MFSQVTYVVNGYQPTIPAPLMAAVQSGDYAADMTGTDKDGNVVFTARIYAAIVKL